MKPKILFNPKDHPDLNSGYGIIARYLLPRLGDHYGRENIIIYTPIYQRDHISQWNGMTVVSGTEFSFGENLILDHYQTYGCNLLIQIGDAWPLGVLPDLAAQDKVLWIQWVPVDWLSMPKNILNRIKPAYKLVPFSKYGENALRRAGLPNVEKAIWLGLNLDIWKPMRREDMPDVMYKLGYSSDTFNILIVAANQERKRVRQELEAISTFRKVNPQANKPRLYLHSALVGERDLRADLDELGLMDIWAYPEPYLMTQGGFPEEEMAKIFNCADLVLNVCMEGFGLSQIQAQACGVPVVCLSEGAGPELVMFGWEASPISVEVSAHQMAVPVPDPIAIAKCIEEAFKLRQQRGLLRSEAAVKFVKDNFGWDRIAEQWFGVIDQAMEDRERHCMQIPEPAEWLRARAEKVLTI